MSKIGFSELANSFAARKLFFFTRILSILLLAFLAYASINFSGQLWKTDFANVTYSAGRMVEDGKVTELYLNPSKNNFDNSAFNLYTHRCLELMPVTSTTAFLYPPFIALMAKFFACFPLRTAFVIWQSFCVFALLLSTIFISKTTNKHWDSFFFLSILFGPVFHLLFEGQMDLVMVLLPLSFGYFLFQRKKAILAGLVWSILSLKPQFFPVIFLFIGSYAISGRLKALYGFTIGIFSSAVINIFCFGPKIATAWFMLLRAHVVLSDNIYPASRYLVSSLPMKLFEQSSFEFKPVLHTLVYFFGTVLFVQALFLCRQLIRTAKTDEESVAPLILILGIAILPIVARYLLFYDLGVFALAGMLIFGVKSLRANKRLITDVFIAWILMDLYMIGFISMKSASIQSRILIALLVWIYIRVFITVKKYRQELANHSETSLAG